MHSSEKDTMSGHIEDATPGEKMNEPTVLDPKEEDPVSTMSPQETRALLRKIDLRVIPILAMLYFLSFLDRGKLKLSYLFFTSPETHANQATSEMPKSRAYRRI